MKLLFAAAALMLAASVFTPAALAEPIHVIWTSSTTGIEYYITTGSSSGSCFELEGEGASCNQINGGHASVNDDGCGGVQAPGSCIIMNTPSDDVTAQGTTSIKCSNGNVYQVSDGGSGACPAADTQTNGGTISCVQQGTSNYASATCNGGCGAISGTGSCTVK